MQKSGKLSAGTDAPTSSKNKEAAREKAGLVAAKLRTLKLESLAKFVEESVEETLSYMDFPTEHWRKIRTNNGLERIMREIRRRTRVVGSFPAGFPAMMLVGARFLTLRRHGSLCGGRERPEFGLCLKFFSFDLRLRTELFSECPEGS